MFDIEKYRQDILSHLKQSFIEDVQQGDHTSLSCIDPNNIQKAKLLVKEDAIIAGIEVARLIAANLTKTLSISEAIQDGARVKKGDIAFYISFSIQ